MREGEGLPLSVNSVKSGSPNSCTGVTASINNAHANCTVLLIMSHHNRIQILQLG